MKKKKEKGKKKERKKEKKRIKGENKGKKKRKKRRVKEQRKTKHKGGEIAEPEGYKKRRNVHRLLWLSARMRYWTILHSFSFTSKFRNLGCSGIIFWREILFELISVE